MLSRFKIYSSGYRSLMAQLAITITIFIVLIEAILLVTSYRAKDKELHALNKTLQESVISRYGHDIPDILEESYIKQRLSDYARNIIVLTLLIIICVVVGSLGVFYLIAGKHIYELIAFNRRFDSSNPQVFPEDKIPGNDIGELIDSHNIVIDDLATSLEDLRETKRHLKEISSFSLLNPDPVFRINPLGEVVLANPAAVEIFKNEDLIGINLIKIIPSLPFANIEHLLKEGGTYQHSSKYLEKSYIFQFVGVPSLNSINVYSLDVTEERELREQVYHASKLSSIGELAAGVGHEINNPLAIISGNIDVLEESCRAGKLAPDELHERFEVIKRSIERSRVIVNSLRSLSRVDLDESVVDVHEAIDEALSLVRKIYAAEGVSVSLNCNAEEAFIDARLGRIQQVVLNLLGNAKDAVKGKDSGHIWIETENANGSIQIRISDNGIGIEDKNIAKIFDSFYTTKAHGKGTGLGLQIVHSIVNEMGGKISVKSKMGEGTEFKIEVPNRAPTTKTSTQPSQENYDLSFLDSMTVLLVDDEPDLRELLQAMLENFGLKVTTCADGQEAFDLIESEKSFDYIFSDVTMPHLSGVQLLNKVRLECGKKTKFVFMTGGDAPEVGDLEYEGLLLKPFQKGGLREILAKLAPKYSDKTKKAS